MEYLVTAFFVVWIPTAFFTASVAASKECNMISWFIGGFLFGPLALIAIAGMPDRRTRKYLRRIAEKLDPDMTNDSKKIIKDESLSPEERKELIKKVSKKN